MYGTQVAHEWATAPPPPDGRPDLSASTWDIAELDALQAAVDRTAEAERAARFAALVAPAYHGRLLRLPRETPLRNSRRTPASRLAVQPATAPEVRAREHGKDARVERLSAVIAPHPDVSISRGHPRRGSRERVDLTERLAWAGLALCPLRSRRRTPPG
jgi:hypothetical protein